MTRFFRIEHEGRPRHVIAEGNEWHLLEGELFGVHRPGRRHSVERSSPARAGAAVEDRGVGLNYKDHAAEQNKPLPPEPLIFLKPSTAVIGPGEPIVIPDGVGRVDHEAEVGDRHRRRAPSESPRQTRTTTSSASRV